MALSPQDPSSYSRPDHIKTNDIHLDWDLDFETKIVTGSCTLSMEKIMSDISSVILDCNKINISCIKLDETGEDLAFNISGQTSCGSKLEIQLPSGSPKIFKLFIQYKTTSECTALQWMEPEQTSSGTHPYLFSQCQAIEARSLLPCQDTPAIKSTFTASVTAPDGITVLMSANRTEDEPKICCDGKKLKYSFVQGVPVQSYLIAIAAGNIKSRKIGPRSHVWAEESFLDEAAFDFSDTENMLKIAEELNGPYVWGQYDILVLPGSFPFGGMENPCLTFVTPSLLSGDKSNANVIAHEISHSWTGNLVTNSNFEHFWLNEGFTVFVEQKILGRLHGEPFRHFNAILKWSGLEETINEEFGPTHEFTKLVPDLKGVHPEDAYCRVPYDKGASFLWYLEKIVGGPDHFEPFLRAYYDKFKYMSISSESFKQFFLEYFNSCCDVKTIDWNTWLYSPGMPPHKPDYDESLAKVCYDLSGKWQEWDSNSQCECPFTGDELNNFKGEQIQEFLNSLIAGTSLSLTTVQKMDSLYKLSSSKNVEIVFRWIRIGLASRYEKVVDEAVDLVTKVGRMKFTRPIYRDLYNWEEKRHVALNTYNKTKDKMMTVSRDMIAKDLHLRD